MTERRGGFTLLELLVVVTIVATVAAIAIPSLQAVRISGNESSAISSLRTFFTVQDQYRSRHGRYAASLPALENNGYIDSLLAAGLKAGYRFENLVSVANINFSLEANPDDPGWTGVRHFFVDESGVIRFTGGGPAGPADSPID